MTRVQREEDLLRQKTDQESQPWTLKEAFHHHFYALLSTDKSFIGKISTTLEFKFRTGVPITGATMPQRFEWKPEYSVSISICDAQHKKILLLADNLHEAMRQGRERDVLSSLLSEFVSNTRTHCIDEEELMAGNAYSEFDQHRREHEKLLRQVNEFQKSFASGNAHIIVELMNFLQKCITNHILETDSRYGDYLNAQGVY